MGPLYLCEVNRTDRSGWWMPRARARRTVLSAENLLSNGFARCRDPRAARGRLSAASDPATDAMIVLGGEAPMR